MRSIAAALITAAGLLATALPAAAASGDQDPTFSGDGEETTVVQRGAIGNAVAVQDDGKILVAGLGFRDDANFAVVRYLQGGMLDPSFSGNGIATTDFGGDDEAKGLAIQDDGKIVLVGDRGDPDSGERDVAVARYNDDGTLDDSFSGDGKRITDLGGVDYPVDSDVAIDPNGRILTVGDTTAGQGGMENFGFVRYRPSGRLDDSFSSDGMRTVDFDDRPDRPYGVAVQEDGRIVVAGETNADPRPGSNFALARLRPDGQRLDDSFAGDGRQITDFGSADFARDVALQDNGRIVAAGSSGTTTQGRDFALARYRSDGRLDDSFAGDGRRTTGFPEGAIASGVGIQDDGKIVLAGSYADIESVNADFALARYTNGGQLDDAFGGDGRQTTHIEGDDVAMGMAIAPDGKIVAGGTTFPVVADTPTKFAVARYLP